MARPLRPLVENGIYHVTSRGNDRAQIFLDEQDHLGFLDELDQAVDRFGWRCFSYCLMGNHFHVLVQTPQPNLSRGVQCLKMAYAQRFNRRHDCSGHLFGGRFHSPLIQADAHLLEVFRYIALNPVRAQLCSDPLEWRWSAHAALLGRAPAPDLLDVDGAHRWFGEPSDPARYERFVKGPSIIEYEPKGAVFGDDEFKRSVLPAKRPSPEIPEREWGDGRPALADVLERSPGSLGIGLAYRTYGYSLPTIASHLGCSARTVGRRLREYEAGMAGCQI